MSQTVSIPVEAARAAIKALACDPAGAEHAAAIERALNPPQVWVLTVEPAYDAPYDCYPYYLGHSGEATDWDFGDAEDAQLFSDADKEGFDAQAYAAANAITDPEVLEQLAQAQFQLAPSGDEVADSFSAGNTEIDYLESLSTLAKRAHEFAAAL